MRIRRIALLALVTALATMTTVPAFAQVEEELTGLDRARQAALQAVEESNSRAVEARGELPPGLAKEKKNGKSGEKLTGRERAAASIARALEPGNGNGNGHGFGRGHAAEVLGAFLAGESLSVLEPSEKHGPEVSAMVHAYNELRRQERTGG